MEELAEGLRRWTARHDEWEEDVASLAVETADGLVLVDPLEPPPDLPRPEHVLLTVFFHARDAVALGAPHVWAHKRGVRRLRNRGVQVTDAFEAGDRLPGGIEPIVTQRAGEVVYWLPDQRAAVTGDVLLGAGAKPRATDDPLRLCPESWLGDTGTLDDLRAALRPLLDLPVERVLPSHGAPVLSGAREALERLLL